MSQVARKIEATIDLAPWRISTIDYWLVVSAAAAEVTGELNSNHTLTGTLARFGYQRATINGVRGVARNGIMKRPDRGPHPWARNWLWLARLKRRLDARGVKL